MREYTPDRIALGSNSSGGAYGRRKHHEELEDPGDPEAIVNY